MDAEVTSLFIDTEASFPEDLLDDGFTHAIHSGSALSINDTAPFLDRAVDFIRKARDRGMSQMGICYGHQLVCRALVGIEAVCACPNGMEAGWRPVNFLDEAVKALDIRKTEHVWQHHFDEVTEPPEGSDISGPRTRIAESKHTSTANSTCSALSSIPNLTKRSATRSTWMTGSFWKRTAMMLMNWSSRDRPLTLGGGVLWLLSESTG